uniref:Uncharacterized protein n=1 Tax=Arundo donax TaxID=35708 RepID=A0A0A9EV13_ARUDO
MLILVLTGVAGVC